MHKKIILPMYKVFFLLGIFFKCSLLIAQNTYQISGHVHDKEGPLAFASVYLQDTEIGVLTDEAGYFSIPDVAAGTYMVVVSYVGYREQAKKINLSQNTQLEFVVHSDESLEEVVITGTMRSVSRLDTPVPVEIYRSAFFLKNPTPNLFEGLQNVNGVRPQVNCSVCNTGDIHINGLEGPYTFVMIDGMPIVSGLSTVYGLMGIPNSLIDQVEIVKGPASSLYGSEAVGGLINVITKLPEYAPRFFIDWSATSWSEINTDLSFTLPVGSKAVTLTGINYYNYSQPMDHNGDMFTDVTLQNRISVFHKWGVNRRENRDFSIAGRFFYEDRWGGEMHWTSDDRGGDEVYGESIYTTRYELFGKYQLPTTEKMTLQFSYTYHDQNSMYGTTPFLALQQIGFGQFVWDKTVQNHDWLIGVGARYTHYDDNTPATQNSDRVWIPSVFVQDEITLGTAHRLLLGARYDYDQRHGSIFTPRLAYKWNWSDTDIFRINSGTGFRVVNLFTEDHAAVTGAREVVITENLLPEKSYNINFNYLKKMHSRSGALYSVEGAAWYTYFTNRIVPDYDTHPNQIIYSNLDGYAVSKGISVNADASFGSRWKAMLGVTFQEVTQHEDGIKKEPVLTEKWMGTWSLSYQFKKMDLTLDYTGNLYGPMRLPLLGELDPRPEYSPWWSIQNIQLSYTGFKNIEIYGGVKNLLDWTPAKHTPFLIARSSDPFDKEVVFDENGQVVPTPDNPYALTFDPSYIYASNQGIRGFIGVRLTLK